MEIKCQLDAAEVFIADLIACSTCFGQYFAHHQDRETEIFTAYGILQSGLYRMLYSCVTQNIKLHTWI